MMNTSLLRHSRKVAVVAIQCQDVKGIELYFIIMLARVQGIEIANAVGLEDHGLAMYDELLCAFFSAAVPAAS